MRICAHAARTLPRFFSRWGWVMRCQVILALITDFMGISVKTYKIITLYRRMHEIFIIYEANGGGGVQQISNK